MAEEEACAGGLEEAVLDWEVVDGIGGTVVAEEDIWLRFGAMFCCLVLI